MLRNAFLAAALSLATLTAAQAQDTGPRLIGGGENAQVVYAEPSRNVVGGGVATLSGGGDNAQIAYGPSVTNEAGTGLVAELVGGGENAQVVYHQAAPPTSMIAGRPVRQGG